MECLANYQQMVDPTMVWGTIKSDGAVRMDVSFTWKRMADPCSLSDSGRIGSRWARKLPYYHLKKLPGRRQSEQVITAAGIADAERAQLSFNLKSIFFDGERLY